MKINSITILKYLKKLVNKLQSAIERKLTAAIAEQEEAKRRKQLATIQAMQALKKAEVAHAINADKKVSKLADKLTELSNV